MNLSTLTAMRDELERIQGGIGLGGREDNPKYLTEGPSLNTPSDRSITSDITFGSQGPSLGDAAYRAMLSMTEE